MQLFEGYSRAYGVYAVPNKVVNDGEKVKGRAATIKREVTVELWDDHLLGVKGIGIVPINENSQCKFGAIDIDEYVGFDLNKLNNRIIAAKFPLVVCRSKSGGAHLYLFVSEFVPAKLVQDKLREFASHLGYGDCEIYPRQTHVLVERGDIGQWINMPYFGNDQTTRYALGFSGKILSTYEFVKLAHARRVTPKDLAEVKIHEENRLPGGPPCLNHLAQHGFPEGTRNNGLMNLGVYCIKSSPDSWREKLDAYNLKLMDPPLSSEEVQGVITSLAKKDYSYTCNSQPIQPHCNKARCRGCAFGIGDLDFGMPKMGTLTKLCTQPPIWFLEVEGAGRMELCTDDLQSPMSFQHRCMEALNIMPRLPKRENWHEIVRKLLEGLVVIEVPVEATQKGTLIQHLEDFCTSRVQAKNADELLLGKPWTHDHRHYFRLRDFISYLDRQKFKILNMNQVVMYVKDHGARRHFKNIRGRGVSCFSINEFQKQTEAFDVPEMGAGEEF
jgi:hypothetical protein